MEGFPVSALGNGLGVVGVVALVGWLIATGRLVTRREHDNRIADKDGEIKSLRETLEKLTGGVGQTLDQILAAVKARANRTGGGSR